MDKKKSLEFLQNSILSPLLFQEDVTDVSYNGRNIFYVHNLKGRCKSDISISEDEARNFIRQIANLSEKQFSYQTPKLDVSIGRFRINALYPSIPKKDGDNVLNFAIRIAKEKPAINDQSTFLNAELICLFKVLVKSKMSIVISGITGSGKTELQKYLINCFADYTRVIVIDNILELDYLNDDRLDLNVWQVDEKNKEATIEELVRNALRSNPDWLIVAESRGKEMSDVLNSAITGHPIITTVHAFDINSTPTRIARMVMMNEQKQDYALLLKDIYYHFRFYVYLNWRIDDSGNVLRYVSEIAFFSEAGKKKTIYRFMNDKKETFKMTPTILERLDYQNNKDFIRFYVEGDK